MSIAYMLDKIKMKRFTKHCNYGYSASLDEC